jgi:hypothetical protein
MATKKKPAKRKATKSKRKPARKANGQFKNKGK